LALFGCFVADEVGPEEVLHRLARFDSPLGAVLPHSLWKAFEVMQKLSLIASAREQLVNAAREPHGRSARTVYGGHEHVLRQTVIALAAGQQLSEHDNPGEATLYVLHGRVRLVAGEDSWEGSSGDLLIVPPSRHSLHSLEDAAVLLTVAKTPQR
jgi:quercetin dioxygenase-like cupin family protein